MASDGDVVRAVLAGDREAYRHLVTRHQDALYRHAWRMLGSEDEAADVVQRALVRGYRSLDQCRNPEQVSDWLYRIVSNLCRDTIRAGRRAEAREARSADPSPASPDPAGEAERSELRGALRTALDRLGADQREAFLLKHVDGLSYDEMAERTEASVSALKMRVKRAREELQHQLRVYG